MNWRIRATIIRRNKPCVSGRKYSDLMEPMETYILVQEYLHDDPSGEKRKNLLSKEKQCSECGKVRIACFATRSNMPYSN